jgi:hypothetical protein
MLVIVIIAACAVAATVEIGIISGWRLSVVVFAGFAVSFMTGHIIFLILRDARDTGLLPARRNRKRPLRILNAIVKGLWSAKTYERVFKPVIADIHHEWADARRRHEKFRAWWIRNVRGRYAVLEVATRQLPWSAWSAIKRLAQLMFTYSK